MLVQQNNTYWTIYKQAILLNQNKICLAQQKFPAGPMGILLELQ